MTPSQSALLDYLAIPGNTLDGFNAALKATPTPEATRAAVGDTALIVAAPNLQGDAKAIAESALAELTKDTQTKLDALSTTSLAQQAGFTGPVTQDDVKAAEAAAIEDARQLKIDVLWSALNAEWNAFNAEITKLRQTVGAPVDADLAALRTRLGVG